MTYEQILTETRGRVGVITLNRPDRLNAMTATMHRELRARLVTLEQRLPGEG